MLAVFHVRVPLKAIVKELTVSDLALIVENILIQEVQEMTEE